MMVTVGRRAHDLMDRSGTSREGADETRHIAPHLMALRAVTDA